MSEIQQNQIELQYNLAMRTIRDQKQKMIDKIDYILTPQDWKYRIQVDMAQKSIIDRHRPILGGVQLDDTEFINRSIQHGERIRQIVDKFHSFNFDGQQEKVQLLGPYQYQNGDLYFGQYKNGKREGVGEMWDIHNNFYKGWFDNNRFQGKGRMIDINNTVYEGDWVAGCMNGYGKIMNMQGCQYEGEWFENMKNGVGEEVYANGTVYKGIHMFGLKNGKADITFSDKSSFVGQMVQNQLANGVYSFKYGVYEGSFKNNRFHGQGKLVIHDYQVFLEDIKKAEQLQLKRTNLKEYEKKQRVNKIKELFKQKGVEVAKNQAKLQKEEKKKIMMIDKEFRKQEEKRLKQEEKERKQEEKKRKQEEKKLLKEAKKKGLKHQYTMDEQKKVENVLQFMRTLTMSSKKSTFMEKEIVIEGVFNNGYIDNYNDKEVIQSLAKFKIGNLERKVAALIQDQLLFDISDDQVMGECDQMNQEFEEFRDILDIGSLGDLKDRLLLKLNRLNENEEKDMKLKMIFKQKDQGSIWMKNNDDSNIQLIRSIQSSSRIKVDEENIEVDARDELVGITQKQEQYCIADLAELYLEQTKNNKNLTQNIKRSETSKINQSQYGFSSDISKLNKSKQHANNDFSRSHQA